jgi:nitronate monooxygenase
MNTPTRLRTPLTTLLGMQHPVLLAAMDLVSDARLARAVSEAGGFGFLGGGYGDEAWLKREIALLQPWAQDSGKPFGIGFITWSLAKQPHLLDIALEAKPQAVWLSFGDVSPFAERIKASGAKLVCQVQTEAMAREALAHGADVLVAQGAEAGGHGVSRGTLALVPALVDLAGPLVPVVAAGGIADGRGMAASLMLGAAGIALGTRLYATQEAYGFDAAKQRIVNASGDDSLRGIVFDLSRRNVWPAPYTGRCLVNDHLRRWNGRELELLRDQTAVAERYAAARAAGDFDTAAVIAGESAGLIHDLPTVPALMQRLLAETADRLRQGATFID